MLENVKKIRAIDYTDVTKIHNYVDETVKKALEILEEPNIFGEKEEDISIVIEKAMDIIAIDNFLKKNYKDMAKMKMKKLRKFRHY